MGSGAKGRSGTPRLFDPLPCMTLECRSYQLISAVPLPKVTAALVKAFVFFVAFGVLLASLAVPRSVRAAGAPDALAAQQVVHLLEYVASDYGGSVADGRVTNEKELAEQIEVLDEAARIASKLRRTSQEEQPAEAVAKVKALVEQHQPEAQVVSALKQVRTGLTAFFDVAEAPRELPSRERGKQMFEQHCAACHGSDGRADTPRAREISPRPANLQAPEVARLLSPMRVFTTTRFGVPNTAMVPFPFSDEERWDVAFYVSGLDHPSPVGPTKREARVFGMGELAEQTDDDLRGDLRAAGIAESDVESSLADLRRNAPYDVETLHPKGASRLILHARASLKKLTMELIRGDRERARTRLLSTYLDDVEPVEAPLRGADPALAHDIEAQFKELRGDIDRGATVPDLNKKVATLVASLGRAGRALEGGGDAPTFTSTLLSSAGIAAREGVEAALLIAALLAIVGKAGAGDRKRWVHLGWVSAIAAGVGTWFLTRRVVEMSGLDREMLEGLTALLAASVLFYVSYWLFAKREAARWMTYLRERAGSGRAAFSLFGISFLAVYREAFETIIFFQPLVSQPGATAPAAAGAAVGAGLLIALVLAYGRAGRFAPPRSFFAFSTVLLYSLAVVFAGQGISALQTTGSLPLHPVAWPHLPALGVYPTLETYAAQTILVVLAVVAAFVARGQRPPKAPPGPAGGGIAGSREGVKL